MGSHDAGTAFEQTMRAYRHAAQAHTEEFSSHVPVFLPQIDAIRPGQLVLDVGCGGGRDVTWLRKRGHTVVGCDVVMEMLRGFSGGVAADARCLPFPDGVFDAVYSNAGLVHLPLEAARDAFCEMRRVAVLGAPFHVTLRSATSGTGAWESSPWGERWYEVWDETTLQAELSAAGVTVVQIDEEPDSTRAGVRWLHAAGVC